MSFFLNHPICIKFPGSSLSKKKKKFLELNSKGLSFLVQCIRIIARDMGSSPGLGRSHMPQSNEACVPQLQSPHS